MNWVELFMKGLGLLERLIVFILFLLSPKLWTYFLSFSFLTTWPAHGHPFSHIIFFFVLKGGDVWCICSLELEISAFGWMSFTNRTNPHGLTLFYFTELLLLSKVTIISYFTELLLLSKVTIISYFHVYSTFLISS